MAKSLLERLLHLALEAVGQRRAPKRRHYWEDDDYEIYGRPYYTGRHRDDDDYYHPYKGYKQRKRHLKRAKYRKPQGLHKLLRRLAD
jgi:hypothetical protein